MQESRVTISCLKWVTLESVVVVCRVAEIPSGKIEQAKLKAALVGGPDIVLPEFIQRWESDTWQSASTSLGCANCHLLHSRQVKSKLEQGDRFFRKLCQGWFAENFLWLVQWKIECLKLSGISSSWSVDSSWGLVGWWPAAYLGPLPNISFRSCLSSIINVLTNYEIVQSDDACMQKKK